MSRKVWKTFEDNLLTHSAAHYLMTIRELREAQGYARVTDIARRMKITRGSCSISLKPLKKRGLVIEDDNRFLTLSKEGLRLARLVEKNDELLEAFFRDVLGVGADQAEIDACKIEHLLSIETSVRLAAFIDLVRSDKDVARRFLRLAKRQAPSCDFDVRDCPTCGGSCLYEDAGGKKSGPKGGSK